VRSAIITLALTTAALLAAGCAANTTGTPVPAGNPGGTSSAPSSGSVPPGVPNVSIPLDTTKYQQNPCSMLTSAQLQALGITATSAASTGKDGNLACTWQNANTPAQFEMAVITHFSPGTPHGLALFYLKFDARNLRRLPDMHGQPAVLDTLQDPRLGNCAIFVGATNDIAYAFSMAGWTSINDPCGLAVKIVDAATVTMKSGG